MQVSRRRAGTYAQVLCTSRRVSHEVINYEKYIPKKNATFVSSRKRSTVIINPRSYSAAAKTSSLFDQIDEPVSPALENYLKSVSKIDEDTPRRDSAIYATLQTMRWGVKTSDLEAYQTIQKLFDLGAKVYPAEYQEGSPLHDTLFYNSFSPCQVGVIHALVRRGEDVNYVNHQENTPLDYALFFNSNAERRDDLVCALRAYYAIKLSAPFCSRIVDLNLPKRALTHYLAAAGREYNINLRANSESLRS